MHFSPILSSHTIPQQHSPSLPSPATAVGASPNSVISERVANETNLLGDFYVTSTSPQSKSLRSSPMTLTWILCKVRAGEQDGELLTHSTSTKSLASKYPSQEDSLIWPTARPFPLSPHSHCPAYLEEVEDIICIKPVVTEAVQDLDSGAQR